MSLFTKITDIQNLREAWSRVKKNHPASGVDNISYEDYDNNVKEEIRQLNRELADHTYEALPVKTVVLYKGEKARTIALFSMRDKVVQQSVAMVLQKIYEPKFLECSYAYRPGRSALQMVDMIDEKKKNPGYNYFLKTDISKFFDSIDHNIMMSILSRVIKEEDVLALIRGMIESRILDEKTGEITSVPKGILQGSGAAPVLSNIYMIDFDREMSGRGVFYVRYADDMLVLADSKEAVEQARSAIENMLNKLRLKMSDTKTVSGTIEEGFEYLGYSFDRKGKYIGKKAEDLLAIRLEEMWMNSRALPLTEKLRKGAEIVGGWEQYFRDERKAGSILEYAVSVYMVQNKPNEIKQKIFQERFRHENPWKELLAWFINIWKKEGMRKYVLMEYEQFFGCIEQDRTSSDVSSPLFDELISAYERLIIEEDEETYANLIQLYSDMQCFNKASWFEEKRAGANKHTAVEYAEAQDGDASEPWPEMSGADIHRYMTLFVGREDMYVSDGVENNRRKSIPVYEALTEDVVKKHFAGTMTIGTYVRRSNNTVHFFVIDMDISKKVLLQYNTETPEFKQYLKKAANAAAALKKQLAHLGLQTYIEFSGCRGYHIWLLLQEWIPVRYVNALQDIIDDIIRKEEIISDDTMTVEYFPNKQHIKPDKPGQCIKLPLGTHPRTLKTSYFCGSEMQVVNGSAVIKNMVQYSLQAVKRVIGSCKIETADDQPAAGKEELTVDIDCTDVSVNAVLCNCNVMKYLCSKAVKTGYLGHFERMTLLYVFGHMGEEGKTFLHRIMEHTLNYNFSVTERFIKKIPAKPISCIKIRDQYKTVTAEYGCSCSFKRTKNCYPSPVLHAIKQGDSDDLHITMPVSSTLSKEKEKKVIEELNISKQVQELSEKIVEYKKQRRAIDKNVVKLENKLEQIFDDAHVECMEIPMGMLVRRKKERGYEWYIEL